MSLCCITPQCMEFYGIFQVKNTEQDPSAISSDPYDVCLCEEGKHQPNCAIRSWCTSAFPGQEFSVRLAVVGNGGNSDGTFDGVVPGAIRAYFDSSYNATLGFSQTSQASDRALCEDFNYSVGTTEENVTFKLTPEHSFLPSITGELLLINVHVTLDDCPTGFYLSPSTGKCECDPIIDRDNIKCDIDGQKILSPTKLWIGFVSLMFSLE